MKEKGHYIRYSKEMYEVLRDDFVAQQNAFFPYASKDKDAIRRNKVPFHVARPNFVRDADRILHCRYYNRYADKTQVFSLYKNDDISRRIWHVQIVSSIGRNIGRMLNLNKDLIEAIALGHDLGHTPFGHAGERYLSEIYFEKTKRYFWHNAHSARILDKVLKLNVSLQTLDGILCHNGEQVRGEYRPFEYQGATIDSKFKEFDRRLESCYTKENAPDKLIPGTLEGCVVRISDIIAYLGRDRQDAAILGVQIKDAFEENELLGRTNSEFISNIIANLVENSYGESYLKLDEEYASALDYEKQVNYKLIYEARDTNAPYPTIKKMFRRIYEQLLDDLLDKKENTPIFRHHINKIYDGLLNAERLKYEYLKEEPNQIVVDYIASMTDDYFLAIHEFFFPGKEKLKYKSYFPKV